MLVGSWVVGRILQMFSDHKGDQVRHLILVRQAQVKTSTNIILRPVTKLCLLVEADM